MKKIIIAVIVLLVIGAAAIFLRKGDDDEAMISTPTPTGSAPTTPTPSSASGSAATGYKDGSYTSSVFQTERGYGPVQIKVLVSQGKITDVQFVQMPSLPGHTTEVTTEAEPLLKQEAIASQNGTVDIISGATQTTSAFQQALTSTLALAK